MLKERLFGLTGPQGNHGEDVKEYDFHLDSTPTHSYMKFLYKYPAGALPVRAAASRPTDGEASISRSSSCIETGVFSENRYFDVFVEYAKSSPEDILVEITIANRGPEPATIHVLPTVWFRNTWSWTGSARGRCCARPAAPRTARSSRCRNPSTARGGCTAKGDPELLVTENETNVAKLFGSPGPRYAKDGIDAYVVHGQVDAVNPRREGTKAAAHYVATIPAGPSGASGCASATRSRNGPERRSSDRRSRHLCPPSAGGGRLLRDGHPAGAVERRTKRHAAGLRRAALVEAVLPLRREDVAGGGSRHAAASGRAAAPDGMPTWPHLYNADVISMPDKWEYPWYAAWDLAFHCVPLALVDPHFAKEQLVLMLREWYMHPNGQLPAYEWAFGDVNPPVHAWAAWRVYKIEKRRTGVGDRVFLERVFQKLLLNFTWWVNRKDADGKNVFQGGFLGLDNIGVFNRSQQLPTGGYLQQSDATSWMAMYCLNMLAIAIELSDGNPAYEDMASKFWEHFLYIADAMRHRGGHDEVGLWDEHDGFFYDVLQLPNGHVVPLKIRSVVGLIPLFAIETLEPERLAHLKDFNRRLEWFVANRPDLTGGVASMTEPGRGERRLLSTVSPQQLRRVLQVMLDETEFLSEYGIRSMSRFHGARALRIGGQRHDVPRRVRPCGIDQWDLRRELELARAGLVPDQLPDDRVTAEVPSLPRQRFPCGVPDRLRDGISRSAKCRPNCRAG